MTKIHQILKAFWFSTRSPAQLGFARVVFFFSILVLYGSREFAHWNQSPELLQPIWYLRWNDLTQWSSREIEFVQWVWRASLVFSALGFISRISMIVAASLGLLLLGFEHSFGFIPHTHNLTAIGLMIFALSPAGDDISIDRFLLSRHRVVHASPRYTWPLRLFWVVWCATFFTAGIAKLRNSGLAWVYSNTVANYFLIHGHMYHEYATKQKWHLDLLLASQPMACHFLAAGMLALELGAPLALLGKTYRWIFVGGLGFAQLIIALTLVDFRWYIPFYLMWIPWDTISLRLFNPQGRDRLVSAREAAKLK